MVRDHIAPNPPSAYSQVGVVGFRAEEFAIMDTESEDYSHPFFKLLLSLWPGDWRAQLAKMNAAIEHDNFGLQGNRHTKACTEDEWWKWVGILVFAAKADKGGISKLYDKKEQILEELPKIDLSKVMPKYRADQLMKYFPSAFHGENGSDPWNPVRALIDGFNNNRAKKVAASFRTVLDETMSSWSPTTTKFGGLPFLSFILRKPTPLGTEFKTKACTETGKSLF